MFRNMIVHVDDDPDARHRVAMAARMAQAFESRLAGVYLVPIGELTPSVAALLPPAVVEARLTESGHAQHRAEALFRREAALLAAGAVEFRAPAGSALAAAVAHARCADLTVVGQPVGDGGFLRRLAEQVLLGSGGPVLFVPRATAVATPGRNVVVAWDGGREAARAVRDALPLLVAAQRVTVFTATEGAEAADAMVQSQHRLGAWLQAHAVHAQIKRADGSGRDAAERLLSQASDAEADLIVMGGYAHPRAREYVLGGATRTMLEAMTVPVLMSH
ncbi:MAG TPA: universal stress protein [Casimicrobiaceae bacterium]|nr:universal stress protein [Casimicrobiaceae bacterium]